MTSLSVQELYNEKKEELKLKILCGESSCKARKIPVADVNRPGLAIAGFFDYFAHERVQVLGLTEITYINQIPSPQRKKLFQKIFSYKIPCFIVTRNISVPKDFLEVARQSKTPVLSTELMTTKFIMDLILHLEDKLAPETSVHGVLVDVYGIGVLVLGKSGLGKSECALDLIMRGHRLVADDVVDIKRTTEKTLMGSGPEIIKYHMEIRGVGIIDIKSLFGTRAVREKIRIELVVMIEEWDEKKQYDRLGLEQQTTTFLGETLPQIVLPIRPGRNIAILVEIAAMNERLKKLGHFTAREFNLRLLERLQRENKQKGGQESAV